MNLPASEEDSNPPQVPEQIRCAECGGTAHRLPFGPDEGWQPGDVVPYVCSDCGERWDVEV